MEHRAHRIKKSLKNIFPHLGSAVQQQVLEHTGLATIFARVVLDKHFCSGLPKGGASIFENTLELRYH